MLLENIFVSGIILGLKPTIIMLLPPLITIGTVWTRHKWFNKRNRRSPLNFDWLSKFLSKSTGEEVSVKPVLALPGWYVEVKARSDVIVFNPKINSFMLKSQDGQTLTEDRKKRPCFQLEQRCQETADANNKR